MLKKTVQNLALQCRAIFLGENMENDKLYDCALLYTQNNDYEYKIIAQ